MNNNHINNNDLSTTYTQSEMMVSDEGSVLNNLMRNLETNLPQPKLMNRDRIASNPLCITYVSDSNNSSERQKSNSFFPISSNTSETAE